MSHFLGFTVLQFPRCLSYAKIELLSIQKRGAFIQHEVFISYHRNSSAELVEHIVAALESHGIKSLVCPTGCRFKLCRRYC